MGFLYFNIDEFDLAFENWNKAYQFDSENPYYLEYMASRYLSLGKYKKAKQVLDQAILVCRDCSQIYYDLGFVEYYLGNLDDAINNFTFHYNLTDDEYFKIRRSERGLTYESKAAQNYENDNFSNARENYEKALEDYSFSINSLLPNKIKKSSELKLTEILDPEVVDYLTYCISRRAETLFSLSRVLNKLNLDNLEALKSSRNDYKTLIDNQIFGEGTSSSKIDIIDGYLYTFFAVGEYNELIKNAKSIIEKHSDKLKPDELSEIYYFIGEALIIENNNEKALKNFKKAVELNPTSWNHDQYAVALFENGSLDEALFNFNKSIELSPNESILYNNRANFYFEINDFEKAEIDILKSIDLLDYNPFEQYLLLLKIKVENNDFEGQIYYLNKIFKNTNDANTNYWGFEIYLEQNRNIKSIIYLTNAIELVNNGDSKAIVSYKDFTGNKPIDSEIVKLSHLYIERGNLFKLFGDSFEACEDYNTAFSLTKEPEKKKEIKILISQNCNQ